MIKINNDIDNNYRAIIFYKNNYVGECLNELSFLDAQCQIRREQDENYSFRFVKIDSETSSYEISDKYHFNKNGKYIHPISLDLYWPSHEKVLSELVEF